jgi:hypothetical protein
MAETVELYYQPYFSEKQFDQTTPKGFFVLPISPEDIPAAESSKLMHTMIQARHQLTDETEDLQVIVVKVNSHGEEIVPFENLEQAEVTVKEINDHVNHVREGQSEMYRLMHRH